MLRILGHKSKLCDGLTRRELMRVGGLSLFSGMSLPELLRARESTRRQNAALAGSGSAKSVILFNLLGGPSHQDMFDMKPEAPKEIRGEFSPIDTSVPGVQICELLPDVAKLMHKSTLIRTITHSYNSHDPLAIMTGFTGGNAQIPAQPTDPPDIGAICEYLGVGPKDLPNAVCMPCFPGSGQNWRRGGPYGGFLGSQYDPLFSVCDPKFEREPKFNDYDPVMPIGEPMMPALDSLPNMSASRLDRRKSVLQQLDEQFEAASASTAVDSLDEFQQRAFSMLTSSKLRDAFDLNQEPDSARDRYGRNLFGASLLVARRLVERGVPFISVHQDIFKHYGHAYDMHRNNFGMLKNMNLPGLSRSDSGPGRPRPAGIDAGHRHGRNGPHAESERACWSRSLASMRLQPADGRWCQTRARSRSDRQARRVPRASSRASREFRCHGLSTAGYRPAPDGE